MRHGPHTQILLVIKLAICHTAYTLKGSRANSYVAADMQGCQALFIPIYGDSLVNISYLCCH
jgi:hypothetical protein